MSTIPSRLRRITAVAAVECIHLMRDPLTISLLVMVPLMQLALFGYAISFEPMSVPVSISRERANTSDAILGTIKGSGHFLVQDDGLPPGSARERVNNGKALVGIELSGEGEVGAIAVPRVVVDATDPAAVVPALRALEAAFWRRAAEVYAIGPLPDLQVEWLYNPDCKTAWAIAPALAGVIVMIAMLMLGALTLVREREAGTWVSLLSTPVDASDALIGKLLPYLAIAEVQTVIVLLLGGVLFGLPLGKGAGRLLAAAPLYAASYLTLGFAISALADTEMQAIQGAVFFYLPSMLLSGFVFPFQGMPVWARVIGEALPLTHFVRISRSALLKGADGNLQIEEMIPIAIFTIFTIAFGLCAYRQKVE